MEGRRGVGRIGQGKGGKKEKEKERG